MEDNEWVLKKEKRSKKERDGVYEKKEMVNFISSLAETKTTMT
jgi:hypothetical protein